MKRGTAKLVVRDRPASEPALLQEIASRPATPDMTLPPATWWDGHASDPLWTKALGPVNATTRVLLRAMIFEHGFKSVFDVGCGPAIDADPIVKMGVLYSGVDSSKSIVQSCIDRKLNVQLGTLDHLPGDDYSVDAAYCRHAIEYATSPEAALEQMIRVSRQAVILILAQSPDEDDQLDLEKRTPRFDCWGKRRYGRFFDAHSRVSSVHWIEGIGNQGIATQGEAIVLVSLSQK